MLSMICTFASNAGRMHVYWCVQYSEIWTFQLNLQMRKFISHWNASKYTELMFSLLFFFLCCVWINTLTLASGQLFISNKKSDSWVFIWVFSIVCYRICTYFKWFVMCRMTGKNEFEICLMCFASSDATASKWYEIMQSNREWVLVLDCENARASGYCVVHLTGQTPHEYV